MADVDEGGKGEIEFSEFLRAFEKQRAGYIDPEVENDICTSRMHALTCIDIVNAFIALGGGKDKTGTIDNQRLSKLVRDEFGLTIRLDKLIDELDIDKDGKINFEEFRVLFN
jgi:calmodulin